MRFFRPVWALLFVVRDRYIRSPESASEIAHVHTGNASLSLQLPNLLTLRTLPPRPCIHIKNPPFIPHLAAPHHRPLTNLQDLLPQLAHLSRKLVLLL